MWKRSHYFRIIIAILMIAFVLRNVDFYEAGSFLRKLNISSTFLIFSVSFLLIIISTLKWKIFLDYLKLRTPFAKLFKLYIIGYFFNNFLPTNFGGDTVRFLFTARGRETYTDSFVAVFMERFIGFVGLLLLFVVSFPVALSRFHFFGMMRYIIPSFAILAGCIGVVLFVEPAVVKRVPLSNAVLTRVRDKFIKVLTTIQSFRKQKQIVAYALTLSLLFNIFAIINVYVVAWALEIKISLHHLFLLVPIILLISAIPFSINGIGIIEGAYVVCLIQAGISAPAALSIALVMRGKNVVLSLVGGILLVLYKKHWVNPNGCMFGERQRK